MITGYWQWDIVFLACLAWAGYTDLRTRRIANKLTYPLLLAGLGLAFNRGEILYMWPQYLIAFGLLVCVVELGWVGGGDGKLMLAELLWGGWQLWFNASVLCIFLGVVVGLLYEAWLGVAGKTLSKLGKLAKASFMSLVTGDVGGVVRIVAATASVDMDQPENAVRAIPMGTVFAVSYVVALVLF